DWNLGEKFANNVDMRHQLNVSGTYTLNRLKLALGFNWHSGKPTTLINNSVSEATNSLVYGNPNANNLPDYWRTDISAVYDIRSDLNLGEKFANNVDMRHQLNVSGTYTLNRLKLALGFNWHSGKPTTLINNSVSEATNSLVYGNPNANNLPDYWRTDISAVYDI